ncbi:hypothetical protein KC675_02620 [Candidatus Dojkabacteria bacterium]|uniref:Uncharacterized protein n=1 Tax=Candidatus Dojkabacteria bacterium TaxID=2099670 RepID=A0A955I7R0_9BACT|nr:hypothetical protein [Candidatus Dojkabacteria bacterium]
MNMSQWQSAMTIDLYKSCCSEWHNYSHTDSGNEVDNSIATIVVDENGVYSKL